MQFVSNLKIKISIKSLFLDRSKILCYINYAFLQESGKKDKSCNRMVSGYTQTLKLIFFSIDSLNRRPQLDICASRMHRHHASEDLYIADLDLKFHSAEDIINYT